MAVASTAMPTVTVSATSVRCRSLGGSLPLDQHFTKHLLVQCLASVSSSLADLHRKVLSFLQRHRSPTSLSIDSAQFLSPFAISQPGKNSPQSPISIMKIVPDQLSISLFVMLAPLVAFSMPISQHERFPMTGDGIKQFTLRLQEDLQAKILTGKSSKPPVA